MKIVTSKDTTAIAPLLDDLFHFKIGQLVAEVSIMRQWEAEIMINADVKTGWMDRRGVPPVLVVIERHIQECHGGIQVQYTCAHSNKDRVRVVSRLFEYELIDYDAANESTARARVAAAAIARDLQTEGGEAE